MMRLAVPRVKTASRRERFLCRDDQQPALPDGIALDVIIQPDGFHRGIVLAGNVPQLLALIGKIQHGSRTILRRLRAALVQLDRADLSGRNILIE